MSRRKNQLIALGIFVAASVITPAALAGSAEASVPDKTIWRVMFQHPKYNEPCPLTVYSEDLSTTAAMNHAALSPTDVPAMQQHSVDAASDVVRD